MSAVDLVRKYALRGADALHLAVASRLSREFEKTRDQLVFQTADDELVRAGREAGLPFENPLNPAKRLPS